MSSVVGVAPPQHEMLSASEDGLPQQEASVGGVAAPRVSAIVPYRARTAARISSWVSVSILSSPLIVTVLNFLYYLAHAPHTRRSCIPALRAASHAAEVCRSTSNAVGGVGRLERGCKARCHQPTSCQVPSLYPTA